MMRALPRPQTAKRVTLTIDARRHPAGASVVVPVRTGITVARSVIPVGAVARSVVVARTVIDRTVVAVGGIAVPVPVAITVSRIAVPISGIAAERRAGEQANSNPGTDPAAIASRFR